MATRIEDCVAVFLLQALETHRFAELCVGVLLETTGDVGLEAGVFALGIKRWATALGGGQGDLGASILEHVVRRGEFLQPEAGLATSVAELVVGGQNHQDFHHAPLCMAGRGQAWLPLGGRWPDGPALSKDCRSRDRRTAIFVTVP